MSSSIKDLLNKFFDLCREYQQEISPQKRAEISREYTDRLDGWIILILADLRKDLEDNDFYPNLSEIYPNFF